MSARRSGICVLAAAILSAAGAAAVAPAGGKVVRGVGVDGPLARGVNVVSAAPRAVASAKAQGDRLLAPGTAETQIGDGNDPAAQTVCPGSPVKVDAFTLKTSKGTDSVSIVTIQLQPAGASEVLGLVEVTDSSGNPLGSVALPPSDSVVVALASPFQVGTTAKDLGVRITPKLNADLPLPQAYQVSARVTALTCANAVAGSDASSAVVTIDNRSPDSPSSLVAEPGDHAVSLRWTSPSEAVEFIVARANGATNAVPTPGGRYQVGDVLGGPVIYADAGAAATDSGLTNGTKYLYKVFARNRCFNWSGPAAVEATPRPPRQTIVGEGAGEPPSLRICPGENATLLDAFSLATAEIGDADSVAAVTVELAPGTAQALSLVEIVDASGRRLGAAAPGAGSDSVPVVLSPNIAATSAVKQYGVRITPKTYAQMPSPRREYPVTGVVGAIACGDPPVYQDRESATVTVDHLPPGEVTGLRATSDDRGADLKWTNPTDDFAEVLVVRGTAPVSFAPVDGTTSYAAGQTVGNGQEVRYVGPLAGFTDLGLTNGTRYHYKVFARDVCGNWSAGATVEVLPTPTVTRVENGADPQDSSRCPGGPAAEVDAFVVAATRGTDAITRLTVELAPGSALGVGLIEIADAAGATVYGKVADPPSDTVEIALGRSIVVTTAPAPYVVRITPRAHVGMPSPPGAELRITARISGAICTNLFESADSGSATLTLDNAAPASPRFESVVAEDAQVALRWRNPAADFDQVVLVRTVEASFSTAPEEGRSYSVGAALGGGEVVYVGTDNSYVDRGLGNGTRYLYEVVAADRCRNWSAADVSAPQTPTASLTTVGNGTDPESAERCPGGAPAAVDAFTLQTSRQTDQVTGLTVRLAAGSAEAIEVVEITDADGRTAYGSARRPMSDDVSITLGEPIQVGVRAIEYRVRLTPRSHADMPAPPGRLYEVTARVSGLECGFAKAYEDGASATLKIDNASPASPQWLGYRPGESSVALEWSNPSDADFGELLLLAAPWPIDAVPAEGERYLRGEKVGGAEIRFIGRLTTFVDTGLSDPKAMYYRLFARDTCGNFSAGIQLGPGMQPVDAGQSPAIEIYDLGGCSCGQSGVPASGVLLLMLLAACSLLRRGRGRGAS